jgi:hypothetical protein
MISKKTKVRAAFIRGPIPLIAGTLLICVLILMLLMSPNPRGALGCTPEMWETPALYLEHIGAEDKPINSIVIATGRPNERELDCGAPRLPYRPEVFLVKDEELAQVNRLLKEGKPNGEGTEEPREFRYVLVSKSGTVESGILDPTQSDEFLIALATYFDHRQPEVHERLTVTFWWLFRN